MRKVVVGEGDVDRAILRAICRNEFKVPTPDPGEPQGREAAIRRAAVAAKQLDQRIVLVLDLNGSQPEDIQRDVERVLREVWQGGLLRKEPWYIYKESALRIVPAGLPGDSLLAELGVRRFMSDDYLVRLLLADEALLAFCRAENNLAYQPEKSGRLRAILIDLVKTLQKNGVAVDSSKRLVHLLAATLGFPASRSKLAARLISRTPENLLEEVLGGFRRHIVEDPPL